MGVKYFLLFSIATTLLSLSCTIATSPGSQVVTVNWPETSFILSSNQILFSSSRDGNEEIYMMNSDGSEQTRITNNSASDNQPSCSPDGKKIAFVSNRDGTPQIYIMNADGGSQQKLTKGIGPYSSPCWSPDGEKITYYSPGTNDRSGIYTINSDGTMQKRLTVAVKGPDECPAWSTDSTKIAFQSTRDGSLYQIYILDVEKGGIERLTSRGTPIYTTTSPMPKLLISGYSPTWAPDDKQIVYRCLIQETQNGKSIQRINKIYVINSNGIGDSTAISQGPNDSWPSWSPDGKKIAFVSWNDEYKKHQINTINSDGGLTHLITNDFDGMYPRWARVNGKTK